MRNRVSVAQIGPIHAKPSRGFDKRMPDNPAFDAPMRHRVFTERSSAMSESDMTARVTPHRAPSSSAPQTSTGAIPAERCSPQDGALRAPDRARHGLVRMRACSASPQHSTARRLIRNPLFLASNPPRASSTRSRIAALSAPLAHRERAKRHCVNHRPDHEASGRFASRSSTTPFIPGGTGSSSSSAGHCACAALTAARTAATATRSLTPASRAKAR